MATRDLTDIIIRITLKGAQCPRKSADISVKRRVQSCYNIYVTFLKALLLNTLSIRYYAARQRLKKSHGNGVENTGDI